jgi:hypothetical protein
MSKIEKQLTEEVKHLKSEVEFLRGLVTKLMAQQGTPITPAPITPITWPIPTEDQTIKVEPIWRVPFPGEPGYVTCGDVSA